MTGQHNVARIQSTRLHQDSGHRAAALVQTRFDDQTLGCGLHRGLEFQHFGLQEHLLEQVVNAHTGFGRDGDKRRFATEFFGHNFFRNQLGTHALDVRIGLVHLVDGNNDRHTGCFGVLDGFFGLRHDAVVTSHHQDDDVGGLCTTGTHGREGLVTGGVQERDHAARRFDVVSTNVLGDATGFARSHFGSADVVKQRSFTVVNVAHDGHHRGTRQRLGVLIQHFVVGEGFWIVQRSDHRFVAHFFHHNHGGVLVQRLVHRGHLAELHQVLDDL